MGTITVMEWNKGRIVATIADESSLGSALSTSVAAYILNVSYI